MPRIPFSRLRVPAHGAHVRTTLLPPQEVTQAHTHDFHEFFLVVRGAGRHRINALEVALRPGALVVIRPEDQHNFVTDETELCFINVAVSAAWWRAFQAVTGLPSGWEKRGEIPGHCHMTPRAWETLERRLRGLEAIHGGTGLAVADVWAQVADAVQSAETGTSRAEPPEWLEAWRQAVTTAELEQLVEPIAGWQRRSGRTAEHLARSCRRYYGVTPSALLSSARIEYAKRLLLSTREKVISVALDCGFGTLAHFHRLFLAQTGMTPRAWRGRHSVVVPR